MATLAGLFLVALSFGLIWSHWRTRQVAQPGQFRRRAITSAMLGLLGMAILTGQFILAAAQPLVFMLFWLAVLALTGALGIGGLLDLRSTRRNTRQALEQHAQELRQLKSELAQAEARRREVRHHENGRSEH